MIDNFPDCLGDRLRRRSTIDSTIWISHARRFRPRRPGYRDLWRLALSGNRAVGGLRLPVSAFVELKFTHDQE